MGFEYCSTVHDSCINDHNRLCNERCSDSESFNDDVSCNRSAKQIIAAIAMQAVEAGKAIFFDASVENGECFEPCESRSSSDGNLNGK